MYEKNIFHLIILSLIIGCTVELKAEDLKNQVSGLKNKRALIHQLSLELQEKRQRYKSDYQYALSKNNELKNEKKSLLKDISKLEASLQEKNVSKQELIAENEQWVNVFRNLLTEYKGQLNAGLPFKKTERLAKVNKFLSNISSASNTQILEKEFREVLVFLSHEKKLGETISYYREEFNKGDETLLAEKLRVGLFNIYSKENNTFYVTYLNNKEWKKEIISEPQFVEELAGYFKAAKLGLTLLYIPIKKEIGGGNE